MPLLHIDSLTYTYPGSKAPALSNIDLRFKTGEFVALIGANNAGKTSLCHALTGVIPHLYFGNMQGNVFVSGKPTSESGVSGIAETVGFVMQNPASQLSGIRYTVREEVAFGLENRGIPREEMESRIDDVLALTGISDLADRMPQQLSGGQQQKVALASVLVCNPTALVLDEPTTFLDPQSAAHVFETLRALCNTGRTIIVATQQLELAARFADRVIAMHKGSVALDGVPQQVLASPKIREIGLDWTRFTMVAALAQKRGLWPENTELATTLQQAENTLNQVRSETCSSK